MKRRAVFLDRDGTINVDVGYPDSYDRVHIYPYAFEAVRKLKAAGLAVVVVTNQSGIGRGFLTEAALAEIHRRLDEDFRAAGAALDAIYHCPHFKGSADPAWDVDCECRKPLPGMARRAAADLGLELDGSYMVGDKLEDVRFGQSFGGRAVLVLTGYGRASREALEREGVVPAHIAADLGAAADWILGREREDGRPGRR